MAGEIKEAVKEVKGKRKESILVTTKGFQHTMLKHTPKSCLNETPVKSAGLQREYSLVRSCFSSGPIYSAAL